MNPRGLVTAAFFIAAIARASPALAESAPGTTFRDCAQCPEMVVVSSGRFIMGAAPGEEEREGVPESFRGRSQPRVDVTIASFALGRYEVTRGEFEEFVAETGYTVGGGCYSIDGEGKWELSPRLDWRNPGFTQSVRHPVVCVSWDDASAYAAWLSRKTGKAYRLPSEAEWEYAARAGSQATRPWGASADDACEHENVWDQGVKSTYPNAISMHACSDGFVHTSPVGSFRSNSFGLHDMIGNAWEWVQDCWNDTLAGMPDSGAARLSGDCSRRVGRGGSWFDNPGVARSANRDGDDPGSRYASIGFRVARSR